MEKFIKLLCATSLIVIWVVFLLFVYHMVAKTGSGAWGGWLIAPLLFSGDLIDGIKK